MFIEIKNIDFAYKHDPVLKNVSTTISFGDFVAFVGPNGSGKSTLIRCIDGILTPGKGSIFLNSKNINHISRNNRAKLIAYVPQAEGYNLSATVYDTVLMGRKPFIGWRPVKQDHAVVIRVLKQLDLENIAMHKVNELSGGQKQRVFIARALAQEPEMLLLDEPTANLDLKHTLEVLNLLKELSQKQITIVMAIHDLNLAVRYCTHIIMLHEGKVFAEGGKEILTPENIQKLYGINIKLIKDKDHILFIPD